MISFFTANPLIPKLPQVPAADWLTAVFLKRKQILKWDFGYESVPRNLTLWRTPLPMVNGEQIAHDYCNNAVVKTFIISEQGCSDGMDYISRIIFLHLRSRRGIDCWITCLWPSAIHAMSWDNHKPKMINHQLRAKSECQRAALPDFQEALSPAKGEPT